MKVAAVARGRTDTARNAGSRPGILLDRVSATSSTVKPPSPADRSAATRAWNNICSAAVSLGLVRR
jgi:hypothetical protein